MTGGRSSTAASLHPAPAADTTRDLYMRHGQRVYSFCASRLRNADEAQDAAQTTFLYVHSALKRGVVPRNELAWLLTIADNVCRSARRSLARRLARAADAEVDELEAAATSMSAETNETLNALRTALGELPSNQRRAILLREWQGLSYADIADQIGVSVAAVETLLFRARRALAAGLERPRAWLQWLDLGSVVALARSVVGGVVGKLAVGAAGVALVVSVPGVESEVRVSEPQRAQTGESVSATVSRRRSSAVRKTAHRRPRPAFATRVGGARSGISRRPTAPAVPTVPADEREAPASAPPLASPPAPPTGTTTTARSAPVAVPGPVSVHAPSPVEAPAPVAPQTVVTTATETVGTVVSSATQALPPVPVAAFHP